MMENTQNNDKNTNTTTQKEVKAKLVQPSKEALSVCGERIRAGKLVSFPTETVYGLGADATSEKAVLSIFEAKGRPLTDPVIVHIASHEMVDRILLDTKERALIKYLGSKLWPGPLTLIGPCNTDYIPPLVGSNTGTVGVRWPDNEIAQKLILASERPIAAPSANRFMHVSPTQASHVFYDLYDQDIHIIEAEQTDLGVESTVCRIMRSEADSEKLEAVILRPGTLEASEIREALRASPEFGSVQLRMKKKKHTVKEGKNACGPGQLLKHYSPNVDCKMILKVPEDESDLEGFKEISADEVDFSKTALIDFGGVFGDFEQKVRVYKDLSESGDYKEALYNLYLTLRECEIFDGVELILVAYCDDGYKEGELGATLFDKIFRSASGVEVFSREKKLYKRDCP